MLQKYLSDVSGVLPPGENLMKILGMAHLCHRSQPPVTVCAAPELALL